MNRIGADERISGGETEVKAIVRRWASATPGPWYGWDTQEVGDLVYFHRIGPQQANPSDPFGVRIAALSDYLVCRRNDLDALLSAPRDVATLLGELARAYAFIDQLQSGPPPTNGASAGTRPGQTALLPAFSSTFNPEG